MFTITHYTQSDIVEIQYPNDSTCYVYPKDSKFLTLRLLRIIEKKQKCQVITKKYKD